MIVEAEPKELALEFIIFCLMDESPMDQRPDRLEEAMRAEKEAMRRPRYNGKAQRRRRL